MSCQHVCIHTLINYDRVLGLGIRSALSQRTTVVGQFQLSRFSSDRSLGIECSMTKAPAKVVRRCRQSKCSHDKLHHPTLFVILCSRDMRQAPTARLQATLRRIDRAYGIGRDFVHSRVRVHVHNTFIHIALKLSNERS